MHSMKNLVHGLLAVSFAVCLSVAAPAAVSECDWCTVETPDSAVPGGDMKVKVTLKKDLPDGQNLSCHMQRTKKSGQWGGLYAWKPAQAISKAGQSATYSFKAKAGADVKEFVPVVFAAPGGDWG